MAYPYSVNEGIAHPPSLVNIFKEIQEDINVTLSREWVISLAGHNKEYFCLMPLLQYAPTRPVAISIRDGKLLPTLSSSLSLTTAQGVVFLLWGGFAKKKTSLIDTKKHCVLTSGHPSPLSANRGYLVWEQTL